MAVFPHCFFSVRFNGANSAEFTFFCHVEPTGCWGIFWPCTNSSSTESDTSHWHSIPSNKCFSAIKWTFPVYTDIRHNLRWKPTHYGGIVVPINEIIRRVVSWTVSRVCASHTSVFYFHTKKSYLFPRTLKTKSGRWLINGAALGNEGAMDLGWQYIYIYSICRYIGRHAYNCFALAIVYFPKS